MCYQSRSTEQLEAVVRSKRHFTLPINGSWLTVAERKVKWTTLLGKS